MILANIGKFILRFIGMGLLLTGLVIFIIENDYLQNVELVEGEVVDFYNIEGSNKYYPIVRYQTDRGRPLEYTSPIGFNPEGKLAKKYEIGDVVEIYYDRETPDAAQIKGVLHQWGLVIISAAFGIFFFAITFMDNFIYFDERLKQILQEESQQNS